MMNKVVFGIDVGGTTIKCGFFSDDGELIEKEELPTRKENSGENILPDIAEYIKMTLAKKEIHGYSRNRDRRSRSSERRRNS